MATIFGHRASLTLDVAGYGKVNATRAIQISDEGITIDPAIVLDAISHAKQQKDVRRQVKAEVDRRMAGL
jgi:hypothetical protein